MNPLLLSSDHLGASCEPIVSPVCGNGVPEAGEECDDGNNDDGDGCSADCLLEPSAGIPMVPPSALILLAALLFGTSFWLIRRPLRNQV